jgi:cell wall-associated NlpC family hydrolase
LLTSAGLAAAEPQPTISQVQKKINQLRSQADQAIQQYDQTQQELASARQRMAAVSRHLHRHRAQFEAARTQIAQIAAAAYENGGMTSIPALVTSSDPNRVIDQSAMLTHVSTIQAAQVQHLITSARQLTSAQQDAARTEAAVAKLEKQQRARKDAIIASVAREKRLLSRLTAAQQATATAGAGGTTSGTYTGPTSTQAGQAVSFAYAQLGKPYVYGATGPSSYDCSGLVQAAWASAGVSIPRDTYSQWASLPHVPMSSTPRSPA